MFVDRKDRIAPLSHASTTLRPAFRARMRAQMRAQLWSEDLPLDSDIVKPRLAPCQVLWAVFDRDTLSRVVDAARRQGFAVDRRTLNRSIVIRLKRS